MKNSENLGSWWRSWHARLLGIFPQGQKLVKCPSIHKHTNQTPFITAGRTRTPLQVENGTSFNSSFLLMQSDGSPIERRGWTAAARRNRARWRVVSVTLCICIYTLYTHDSVAQITGWKFGMLSLSFSIPVIISIRCRCFLVSLSVHFIEEDINRSRCYSRIQSAARSQEGNFKPLVSLWKAGKNSTLM